MKKMKKIVAAAMAMMTFSTAAAVTGTVAWFTANNLVNVSGMTVTTSVESNLLIATSNASDDNYLAQDLVLNISGKVEPVSTTNATAWYYTKDKVKGTGESSTGSQFQTYSNNATFASYYGIDGVVPYVDYAFYLKATAAADNQKVVINNVNLLYKADGTNFSALGENDLAWRVAIYSQKVNKETNVATDGTNVTILKQTSAAYFDSKAVSGVTDGVASFGAVSNLGSEALLDTITAAGTTQRYKVVVRLFLEGNDTRCNNDTYVALTEDYSLSLDCEIGDSTGANAVSGAQVISSVAA